MATSSFSDEELMAYADGQLEAGLSEKIALASAKDSHLAKRIAVFQNSRKLAKQAMDMQLAEPVPAKLEANILAMVAAKKSAQQIAPAPDIVKPPLAPRTASNDNQRQNWFQLMAAASVALVLGALGGSQLTGSNAPATQIAFGELNNTELTQLLTSAPSGEERGLEQGGRFKAIATFNDAQSALCREFEVDGASGQTIVSVACFNSKEWELRFAVAAGQTNQGYAPASSLELLENYYATSGASAVMSAEAEKGALEALKQAE